MQQITQFECKQWVLATSLLYSKLITCFAVLERTQTDPQPSLTCKCKCSMSWLSHQPSVHICNNESYITCPIYVFTYASFLCSHTCTHTGFNLGERAFTHLENQLPPQDTCTCSLPLLHCHYFSHYFDTLCLCPSPWNPSMRSMLLHIHVLKADLTSTTLNGSMKKELRCKKCLNVLS